MKAIRIDRREQIVVVMLDRPAALNAVNAQMRGDLITAMEELNHDPGVRAVVLTGSGERAFCSGQDLAEAQRFSAKEVEGWMRHQGAMFRALRRLDKPLVVAFNGIAAGAGFQMGLVADIRIGFPEIKIGQPEVRVGLASILGSYLMTGYIGHAHNQELSLTGELITGQRAYEIGLLNRLVQRNAVLDEAVAVAQQMIRVPANAIRLTKEHFRSFTDAAFEQAVESVVRYHSDEYATGEPQAVMRGFLETRAQRRK